MTSAQRSPFLPEVPTLVEQGYKDIAVQEWLGWFLPAKTPADIVQQLNTLVREALQAPDYRRAAGHLRPAADAPVARGVRAHREGRPRHAGRPIVRATGFTAED